MSLWDLFRGRLAPISDAGRARLATASAGLIALGFASSPLGASSADMLQRARAPRPTTAVVRLQPTGTAQRRRAADGAGFRDPFTPDSDALDGEARTNMLASIGVRPKPSPTPPPAQDRGGPSLVDLTGGPFSSAVAPIIVLGPRSAALIDDGRALRRVAIGDRLADGIYVDAITGDGVFLSDGEFIRKGAGRQGPGGGPAAVDQVPALFPGTADSPEGGLRAGSVPPAMQGAPGVGPRKTQGQTQQQGPPAMPDFIPPAAGQAGSATPAPAAPCVRYPGNVSGLSALPTCPPSSPGG